MLMASVIGMPQPSPRVGITYASAAWVGWVGRQASQEAGGQSTAKRAAEEKEGGGRAQERELAGLTAGSHLVQPRVFLKREVFIDHVQRGHAGVRILRVASSTSSKSRRSWFQ
jgi:hypothetical protein